MPRFSPGRNTNIRQSLYRGCKKLFFPLNLYVNIKRVAADNIKFLRQKRGLTQEALAFDADIARSYIGYVERAEKTLSIVSLAKIAKALGVKPSALLEPEGYREIK